MLQVSGVSLVFVFLLNIKILISEFSFYYEVKVKD